MKTGLHYLAKRIDYEVPGQDLSYSLARMPSGPRSGMLISNIRLREEAAKEASVG
jgi:fatty-acid peroxygenase